MYAMNQLVPEGFFYLGRKGMLLNLIGTTYIQYTAIADYGPGLKGIQQFLTVVVVGLALKLRNFYLQMKKRCIMIRKKASMRTNEPSLDGEPK